MFKNCGLLGILRKSLSYVLVAVVASAVTLAIWGERDTKLSQLKKVIDKNFVDQADMGKVEDAAASAMVNALGDRWSYYISAEDYAAYQENKNNAYVGVGVTIVAREDGTGFDIEDVTPGSSAKEAGILPGDILIEAQGKPTGDMTSDDLRETIGGKKGATVSLTVLRNGEKLTFNLTLREIKVEVASGELLPGNIGLIRIVNFNANCAKETIALVDSLRKQGADKLIFDVRNNPGGYVNEMVKVLDYLLPEGVVYRDLDNRGNEGERRSDAACVELPMAVLVNGSSYSAAEFFAAVLQEFEWAAVVGEKTTGKGHYQNTIRLSDGSAVNLSTGKYFTPSGKNLTQTGGITPEVTVEVDKETAAQIKSHTITSADDPQIQATVKYLQENKG